MLLDTNSTAVTNFVASHPTFHAVLRASVDGAAMLAPQSGDSLLVGDGRSISLVTPALPLGPDSVFVGWFSDYQDAHVGILQGWGLVGLGLGPQCRVSRALNSADLAGGLALIGAHDANDFLALANRNVSTTFSKVSVELVDSSSANTICSDTSSSTSSTSL